MNPIIEREFRARWRRWQSFALAFAWTALLAALMALIYSGQSHSDEDVEAAARYAGHELFSILAMLQTAAWLFLAPLLTATGIAGERERGLLESLQLSPLGAGQIVRGKLFSALSFAAMLMLAGAPVMAICFLMGGVEPRDFAIFVALQVVTIFFGASLGTFFSAFARRALGALTQSVIVITAWSLATLICFDYKRWSPTRDWWDSIPVLFFWMHPVSAAWTLTDADRSPASSPIASIWPADIPLWALSGVMQILLSLALLYLAGRKLGKPFPEWSPNPRKWSDGWKERVQTRQAARADSRQKRELKDSAQAALLWEFPIEKFIRFANPILQREVRGAFRWRRGSFLLGILQALIFTIGVAAFLFGVSEARDDRASTDLFWGVSFGVLVCIIMASALIGARGFTRERESGTWEGIYLSLMSRREILWGKIGASMLTCACYALPALIVMALCVTFKATELATDSYSCRAPISPIHALATFCVLASSAWCYGSWALLVSRFCKTTATAMISTVVSLLLWLVALPGVLESLSWQFRGRGSSATHSKPPVHSFPLYGRYRLMNPSARIECFVSLRRCGIRFTRWANSTTIANLLASCRWC